MATASVTVTVDKNIEPDVSERYVTLYGTLAIDAAPDTYENTGLTVSFAGVDGVFFSQPPVECRVWSELPATKWIYSFKRGTTIANNLLYVFGLPQAPAGTVGGDPLPELVDGTAIPATLSGDTGIRFAAKFRKGQ